MSQYLTDDQFNEVLSKLFGVVGKKFHSIKRSCRGNNWFMRYCWTEAQEKEFNEWLTKYLVKKQHMPVRLAKKKASMFCFMHGWKYKEEK